MYLIVVFLIVAFIAGRFNVKFKWAALVIGLASIAWFLKVSPITRSQYMLSTILLTLFYIPMILIASYITHYIAKKT